MNRTNGFTLIEILIALFIFAILGTIAAIGLHAVLNTHERIEHTQRELRNMQWAFLLMRRDFTQLIQRPITSTGGEELPALLINSTNHVEFTTGGFINPNAISPRSTLIRVAYELDHHQLVRLTWPVLDRPTQISAQRRILLNHVTHMHFNYVDDHGQLLNVWATNSIISLPQAIIINLTIKNVGNWQGVFPIVGRGNETR